MATCETPHVHIVHVDYFWTLFTSSGPINTKCTLSHCNLVPISKEITSRGNNLVFSSSVSNKMLCLSAQNKGVAKKQNHQRCLIEILTRDATPANKY